MSLLSGAMPPLRALRGGWGWWTGELRAMLPARFLEAGARGPRISIIALREETWIEREHDGLGERFVDPRNITALDEEAWRELSQMVDGACTTLILTPPDIYATEVRLPRAIGGRARDAIALQLDEISPIPPEELCWTVGEGRVDGQDLHVPVVMARETRITELLALLDRQGVGDVAVEACKDERRWALKPAPRSLGVNARRRNLLAAIVLVAAIPLLTAMLATALTWSNQRTIDTIGDAAAAKLRAERRVRDVQAVRTALATVARAPAASAILDDLAEQVPTDASLVSLASQQRGDLALEARVADGDTMRAGLTNDRLYRFAETNQLPDGEDKLKVSYRGRRR